MKLPSILLFAVLLLVACDKKGNQDYNRFFEQAFTLIQDRSVKKYDLNWNVLKKTVKDSITYFQSNDEVYKAIDYTIKLVDDGHSVFLAAQNPAKGPITNDLLLDTLPLPAIETKLLAGNIGYIKLIGFLANDSLTDEYALKIRKASMQLDASAKLSGWIIDLRTNSGGKLPSEPLGLAPLFEQPLIGISGDNKNNFQKIRCTNNYFYFGDYKLDTLEFNSALINKNKKIAVLVSNETVSAGEFLALAFRFQTNTQLFGSITKGKTSHLSLFEFMSNAKLLLATHYYCDRNSRRIRGGIVPDVECNKEESLWKAIAWLNDVQ